MAWRSACSQSARSRCMKAVWMAWVWPPFWTRTGQNLKERWMSKIFSRFSKPKSQRQRPWSRKSSRSPEVPLSV